MPCSTGSRGSMRESASEYDDDVEDDAGSPAFEDVVVVVVVVRGIAAVAPVVLVYPSTDSAVVAIGFDFHAASPFCGIIGFGVEGFEMEDCCGFTVFALVFFFKSMLDANTA
ncbi:hypothetical protein F5Y17DRAFT_446657 [Xylariaceae sp. FL0594]|nr:hypothetical protein F5Y17DRAFT_446657 [Xylariaceae sp. FL0594]